MGVEVAVRPPRCFPASSGSSSQAALNRTPHIWSASYTSVEPWSVTTPCSTSLHCCTPTALWPLTATTSPSAPASCPALMSVGFSCQPVASYVDCDFCLVADDLTVEDLDPICRHLSHFRYPFVHHKWLLDSIERWERIDWEKGQYQRQSPPHHNSQEDADGRYHNTAQHHTLHLSEEF